MSLTDWDSNDNALSLEIGRIIPDVRLKMSNGLSLLPCDGSRYISSDYPLLAASIDSKYIENAVELTKLEHQNFDKYHNGRSCMVESNGVLHVIVSDGEQSGIMSSIDGGSSFSNLTPFSGLSSLSPSGYGIIRASASGQTLLMCHDRNVYISNNRGQTWYQRPQSTAGTHFQYYDVSPNGQNIICVTNVFSGNNRNWASSSDGGQTWIIDTYSGHDGDRYFQFISDTTLVFVNLNSNHNGTYYSSFRSPEKRLAIDRPGGDVKNILAKPGGALVMYGSYMGTYHDSERLYLTLYGWSYVQLPYRKDISGNNLAFGVIKDFTMLDNGDLYVYTSEGLLLLRSGTENWVNVYDPSIPAGMPVNASLSSSNNTLYVVASDAFFTTQGALSPYSFFTPLMSTDGVYKLVGDAQ